MYQLTQLAADRHRQRLAAAEAQRPPSACWRWPGPPAAPSAPNGGCPAARQARRLRAQLQAHTATDQ